jgi:outer membrane protein OmpA-like peptidoglycan-associated protein
VVERKPIGILGNCLVYATRTDLPLDQEFPSFVALRNHYVSGLPPADPMRISLPTSGLYARAHLDECIAAEEHNGSFDWVFSNNEPELADFPAGMFDSRRSETTGLTPTEMPQTIINLQNAPQAPAPTGLGSALTALTNGDAFRDITGLAGTQKSLDAAMANAVGLANTGMGQAAAVYSHAAQLASDERAGKETREFVAALEQARNKGLMSQDGVANAAQTFADRKAQGNEPSGKSSGAEIPENVLSHPGALEISNMAPNGTLSKISKGASPPPKPDIIPTDYVVPIPESREILFMGFKTGSAELKQQHIDFLEILAGQVGISIGDVQSIIGHASKAGSEASNQELGMRRAKALFARLQKLVLPLGASDILEPKFEESKLESKGEHDSLRARFSGVKAVADAPGADDENDPVEKAVVLTLKGSTDLTKMPRTFKYGGVEFKVINNFIFVGNAVICSLPGGGPVKLLNRSSLQVINQNVDTAEVNVGGVKVGLKVGDIASHNSFLNVTVGDVTVGNVSMFNLGRDPGDGRVGDPVEEKPQTEWKLRFFGPKVDGRTLLSMLGDVVEAVPPGGDAALLGSPSDLAKRLANEKKRLSAQSLPNINDLLIDFILKELGFEKLKSLLGMAKIGNIEFNARLIPSAAPESAIEGTFKGFGIMIGTAGTHPGAVMLDNNPYTTKTPLKPSEWDTLEGGKLRHFSYLNSFVTDTGLSTIEGLGQIADTLVNLFDAAVPFFPEFAAKALVEKGFNLVESLVRDLGGNLVDSQLRFKALEGDDGISLSGGDVSAAGAELQLFAMAPGKISFHKKSSGG